MSLSKLPVDLVSSLCGLVDGVTLINLVKCGDKQLNQSLSNAKMSLFFEVTHHGFLNVAQVLVSLATLFPSARSHTFLDVGTKGCLPDFGVSHALIDTTKLSSMRLNVSDFAYVGGGPFILSMGKTLYELMCQSKLDDVFPQVTRWTAGDLGRIYTRAKFEIDYYQKMRSSAVVAFVPSSAQYIRATERTFFVIEPTSHIPIYQLIATGFATDPSVLQMWPCYQSLTALTIGCNQPINASDLPRGLTLFATKCVTSFNGGGVWHPFIFRDAPAGLEHVSLHSRNDFVLPEDVEFNAPSLRTLDVHHMIDKGHRLSALNLPPTLTSLGIGYMRHDGITEDSHDHDDSSDIFHHLFDNIHSDAWTKYWPPQLQIQGPFACTEGSLLNLLGHLVPVAHVPACLYTIKSVLKTLHYSSSPSAEFEPFKKQFGLATFDLAHFLNASAQIFTNGLMLNGDVLSALNDKLHGSIASSDYIASITQVQVAADPNEATMQFFVLHNLPRLCHAVSSLRCEGYYDGGIVVPSWVRELTIDSYPHQLIHTTSSETGLPLEVTSTDLIESLTIVPQDRPWDGEDEITTPTSRLVNDALPHLLLHLPCRLVTLDIYLMTQEIGTIAMHLKEFVASLPKTLQYCHLRGAHCEWSTRFEEEGLAVLLPPGLRLLNWRAFAIRHYKLGRFCKEVAAIPSLNRLIVAFNYIDPPGVDCIPDPYYQSWHCHSAAKPFSNQVGDVPLEQPISVLEPAHPTLPRRFGVTRGLAQMLLGITLALIPLVVVRLGLWWRGA